MSVAGTHFSMGFGEEKYEILMDFVELCTVTVVFQCYWKIIEFWRNNHNIGKLSVKKPVWDEVVYIL